MLSHTGHIRRSIRTCRNRGSGLDFDIGPEAENRLKKLMGILARTALLCKFCTWSRKTIQVLIYRVQASFTFMAGVIITVFVFSNTLDPSMRCTICNTLDVDRFHDIVCARRTRSSPSLASRSASNMVSPLEWTPLWRWTFGTI